EDIGIRAGAPVTYKGAVLEYEPYSVWTEAGGELITKENALIIAQYAMEAKELGVDILVAPEYSIQSMDMQVLNSTLLFSLMQYVPDPVLNFIPCNDPTDPLNVEAVRTLSCAALENEMYIVADLAEVSPCSPTSRNPFNNALDISEECPPSGQFYYNTQVVFDRDGVLIARYRKKNLFLEWQFTPGTDPNEMAIFTTDFGVTFTLQVCFDIAYFNPGVSNIVNYGIKDVIMSTAWVDMLPYHTAPAVQNAWSRGNGVNLLVSGYHYPERAKLGSGIYRGASDLANVYIFDPESGSRLLVSDVSTVATVDVHLTPGDTTEILNAEACHQDGLCCKLNYQPTGILNYSLVAYSGPVIKGWGEYSIYAQVCSILWCAGDDINTCGHIDLGLPDSDSFSMFSLSGNFAQGVYVYSTVFQRNLTLIDNNLYNISQQNTETIISTNGSLPDLLTAGFYARWYERDP
ncbi:hypothetical protein SK128_000972, partial [Halocaridina rubra]